MSEVIERFAPSPNGYLHLGHAFSALTAYEAARAAGGAFILRLEDLDQARARAEFELSLIEDLHWLGIAWPEPVMRQSGRFHHYAEALAKLQARGLLYPCFCTRREINEALYAPQEKAGRRPGLEFGPDGPAYPGACRALSPEQIAQRQEMGESFALRLDMRKAIDALGGGDVVSRLTFHEIDHGPKGETGEIALDPQFLIGACGDVVLARKEFPGSYHLAVVIDDAAQSVSHVTRGRDLFYATHIHRLLQELLGAPPPQYRHHRLIRDPSGRRLAKRDRDLGLRELRLRGASALDIRRLVGLA